MKKFLFAFSLVLIGCNGQAQKQSHVIGFYNVENLFDTINQPHNDEEFLPTGKNKWTSERYVEKLKKTNQVLDSLGNLILLGMCEIENAQVLKDLNAASSSRKHFDVVHHESTDGRGVDVGMIYNPKILKVNQSGFIRFQIPNGDTPNTRDIVWAKFTHKKDTIFAMVNHWPSRRGGQEESEPNRLKAASMATSFIDSVMRVSPTSKIVFMGDLNDYPTNKSVQMVAERLNPMISKSSGKFGGSYNYRNEWDVLDHMMVSPNAYQGRFRIAKNSGHILSSDFIIEEYKGNLVPKRNYAGEKYLNGYSDHLPVKISVLLK
jgi:predicted extracellular nuclease